ncbi:MAG: c-type cytochrome [Nannocystaceae bacterium]|nr:c-type cytochrome [Nannocystaceae bacterium]
MRHTISPFVLGLALVGCGDLESIANPDPTQLDTIEFARFRLGHGLFFDSGLSGAGDVSCSSCHEPSKFGVDGLARSEGTGGAIADRNAPSVFNAALKDRQFWDGRAQTLEEQASGPLFAANEMGQTEEGLIEHVRVAWMQEFDVAFPGEEGPTLEQVTIALASYERMLPRRSRFDQFLDDDRDALSRRERRGLRIFRRNCTECHTGSGVGGADYHKLGKDVPWPQDRREDEGLFEVTGDPSDKMVFMTPSLRNVAETGPWFHDGSVESLEEAVQLMARHQLDRSFTEAQEQALVSFLKALKAEDVQPWAYGDWDAEAAVRDGE